MVLRSLRRFLLRGSAPTAEASAPASGGSPSGGESVGAPNAASAPRTGGDPLDVCLLSYRSDPYSGGQGVYVRYLSRALVELGHSVDVVSGRPYPDLDPRVDLIELPGENIIERTDRLGAFDPGYLREPTKLFEWLSALTGGFPEPYTFGRRAADHLAGRGREYDVVHDNQSLSYGLLEVMGEVPTVATVHHPITVDRETDLAATEDRTARLLVRRWYRFLRMQRRVVGQLPNVVAVSTATKRRTVADFGADPESISVVHNGIDTERFTPRPDVEERPKRVMTTVSADVPLKGLRYLLEAFARIRERDPRAELIVVGAFDDGGTADRLIGELGIGDAVETHTEVSDDRMVELYGTAAVAVVPSLYEGFGLPAGEAMACGVPTVATTGGALPEVIGDAGVLVPPADADALADAVSGLLEDPQRRRELGRRGRERVRARFDWERAARETVAAYRRAIDAHG